VSLTLITPPATEPVTVAEVRDFLRLHDGAGEPAPGAPTVALAGAGAGNVDNGTHQYRVTFVTTDGETQGGQISAQVTVADKTVNGQVAVSAIPIGGSKVTARKLYRTAAGGTDFKLVTTINNNTATTYQDNTADAGLGASVPTVNTTLEPRFTTLITEAREYAEGFMRRALITQTWDLTLDWLPPVIELPKTPLQSVTSLKYLDASGALVTLDPSLYRVDVASKPGRITPAYGTSWPTVHPVTGAVVIRFVAGYGAASAVPERIKQGMKLHIAGGWDNCESEYATAVDRTLWPLRVMTL
jgi:uncharacterized phiE125 gp8 family phage protein